MKKDGAENILLMIFLDYTPWLNVLAYLGIISESDSTDESRDVVQIYNWVICYSIEPKPFRWNVHYVGGT